MKYYSTDYSKDGRDVTRFNFVFGKPELEIIVALIDKALRSFPETSQTRITAGRLQNMKKVMSQAYTDVLQKSLPK